MKRCFLILLMSAMFGFVLAQNNRYVILAQRNASSNWYYLTSVNANTEYTPHLEAVNSGTSNKSNLNVSNLEDKFLWNIEETDSGILLKNGNEYISYFGVNTMGMGQNGQVLSVTSLSDDLVNYWFIDDHNEKRYLSLNTTNDYFSFYKGTQIQNLLVLKYGKQIEPISLDSTLTNSFIILAQRNISSNWFYMTSDLGTASNKRYQAVDTGTNDIENVVAIGLDDKYYWEIEDSKLKNGNQYSTWVSNNSANLSSIGKELTINQLQDGRYTFSFIDGVDTRYLSLNATEGNNYFAYYKGTSQVYQLTLIGINKDNTSINIENTYLHNNSYIKFLRNGHIYILRGEKIYTLTGQEAK